jgi:hypothetical protein
VQQDGGGGIDGGLGAEDVLDVGLAYDDVLPVGGLLAGRDDELGLAVGQARAERGQHYALGVAVAADVRPVKQVHHLAVDPARNQQADIAHVPGVLLGDVVHPRVQLEVAAVVVLRAGALLDEVGHLRNGGDRLVGRDP